MLQSMDILMALYPDEFTSEQLTEHVDDLLERFSNSALGDTIYRVGCDLSRKLNTDDRLMIPVLAGIKSGELKEILLYKRSTKEQPIPETMIFFVILKDNFYSQMQGDAEELHLQ